MRASTAVSVVAHFPFNAPTIASEGGYAFAIAVSLM
jgi:hypothetical protein